MELTQEELSKVFYDQGFVFNMAIPATLSRYTVMEKIGKTYAPVTLDAVLARDPNKFLATVEQHLRDGNVLCYDSRLGDAGRPAPSSLRLNDDNTVQRNRSFKDTPAPVVPEVKYRFWKRMLQGISPRYKAELKTYDDAVRRNTQRTAQVGHFDKPQQTIHRMNLYSSQESRHIETIQKVRSAGHRMASLRGFDSSNEFMAQHPHLARTDTPATRILLEQTQSRLLGNPTFVDPYATDANRPSDTKGKVYAAALSRRPEGYREALGNPNPAPAQGRLPSVLSGDFFMVLEGPKFVAGDAATMNVDYGKYLGDVEKMLDHDKPNPEKLLFEQNEGTKAMWTMCQRISQELTQNMQQLRELNGLTDPANQLAAKIPQGQGGNASADISVVDPIEVNMYSISLINESRERIRCLKELVVSVASNSSAITKENEQTLRECSTLAAHLEKVEDAVRQGKDVTALKMEDSREQGDREINALLATPEVVERMRPMEDRVRENDERIANDARIAKEKDEERLRLQEAENKKKQEDDARKLKEELERLKIKHDREQQDELNRKKKAEEAAALEKQRNNEKIIEDRINQEKEQEEERRKWEAEAPLRKATDQRLKETWAKEDFEESERIGAMTRYGKQNYANARLNKTLDSIGQLQNKTGKSYEEEQTLKHLQGKVATVYAPMVKKYTDYSNALSQDMQRRNEDFKHWRADQELQLSQAKTPSEKSQIDKSWRVASVFGSKPDFVDLKENDCKVNLKDLNQQVISAGSYRGFNQVASASEMQPEQKIVALNLCAALCAPYLPGSKTAKAFAKNKQANELWLATGLLEGVLDGKKPPKEISALLPDALEDGRKYVKDIFAQNDDLVQQNTAIINILNRGIGIMTQMLTTTLTQDPNSSWTIGAKCLTDTMRLRNLCDKYKHNATEKLEEPIMARAAGWTAAYKAHEANCMSSDISSPQTNDRPYLQTAFVVNGEVQNMCVKDYMAFEQYKQSSLGSQAKPDPLQLLQVRSKYGADPSLQPHLCNLGREDSTLEKLSASCRKESDYAKEIERCKDERLREHASYESNKKYEIIEAKRNAENKRKAALDFEKSLLAPRKGPDAPRTLQSTVSKQAAPKKQNQKESAQMDGPR